MSRRYVKPHLRLRVTEFEGKLIWWVERRLTFDRGVKTHGFLDPANAIRAAASL